MSILDSVVNLFLDLGNEPEQAQSTEPIPQGEPVSWATEVGKTKYFLTGYAVANKFTNMQKAIIIAEQYHAGQTRKNGIDYFVHPLRVCDYLISLGFDDDILLSAALLHDVIEDNETVKINPRILVDEYKLDEEVLETVKAVTKEKGISKEQEKAYYENLKKNWRALLIKISDRTNNLSTMEHFKPENRASYIAETREFVLPLCSYAKKYYPNLRNQIVAMKYMLTSLCTSIEYLNNEIMSLKSKLGTK